MDKADVPSNKYIDTYINNYVKPFRRLIASKYAVKICNLANFITTDCYDVRFLLQKLQTYGFEVTIFNGQDAVDEIQVEYTIEGSGKEELFDYRIENLISTIYLSSRTGISIVGMLIMQIISRIICKYKVLYKAVILDLDDTVWKGTLVEDGIEVIKQNLRSNDAVPFVTFMRFVQSMAKELGLYVALCSRNNLDDVLSAIAELGEDEFPLKGHIDCIVANYNDKSKNIKAIAQRLSILTSSCVFIDDNQLIRDEVRQNLPEVFVPDWETHEELLTLIITCCVFDKFELSLRSRNRKRLYEILQQEREKSYLPQLFVKVSEDENHAEAVRLYAKSNQFKFAGTTGFCEGCKSLVFEIYRDTGENLGICSVLTYVESKQGVHVLNWAISCRYFEIGLEEYILLYITLSGRRPITFTFTDTGFNGKVVALMEKYESNFVKDTRNGIVRFIPNAQLISAMSLDTNLKEYCNE